MVGFDCEREGERVVDHGEASVVCAISYDIMHCIGSEEGQEQVGHIMAYIPGRCYGRGELCTAERAGRCSMGPLADAGEVAACVVACRTGEGHGVEMLGANDTPGWGFFLYPAQETGIAFMDWTYLCQDVE